jgi:hypothetical protein
MCSGCGRQPVEARKEDTVMETEGNKEVIRRLYEEGYNARTLTVVDEVAAADVVLRGPVYGEGVSGPEAIKTIKDEINRYHEEGNTIQITYPEQIAEGESVATRYMLDWSGQKFEGVSIAHFADGKIQEYFLVVEEVPPPDRRWASHN